ncbi:hypothetical protein MRS76_10825 [Rhizobiaceae bacterium n13]|uniref:Inner membrane protein n=1 Tax=Ferirhizobium litorale TaxID=2927786 RepID=A0AAE3QHV7_9HYPH|nr:hypothetical protein [Fererhizobium litorale]MDI7862452.1 hypothetical protein [Fererhizobium litorale]MDI7923661.1 hypothetical protein [Fererhizobium litorale]
MATGKPPRRSKATGEPVTTDLDAEQVAPGAAHEAPEKGTETETAAKTEAVEHSTIEADATEAAVAGAEIAEVPGAETGTAKAATTETTSTGIPAEPAPTEPDAAPAAETTFATPREEIPAAPAPPPRRGNSGLIAAGIFGGLVALAGAGSLQYAGFFDPLSPARTPAVDTSEMTSEIEALKQSVASLRAQPRPDNTELEARVAALETAAATAPASGGGDPAAVADLEQKITALNAGIEQLKSEVASNAEARAENTSEISRRLDEAEKKLNEPRTDVAVARAVALASLKAAVDRGGPFLAELDTFAGVAPDDPAIAGLQPFAAAGVPSRAELMRQFPDAASAILAAIHKADPDAGIAERLMDSALSLVKVRPVGNIEGEGPDAVVARIEDKLKNGDLKGAALEWVNLPQPAQAAAANFKTALDNRLKVEELVDTAMKSNTAATSNEG